MGAKLDQILKGDLGWKTLAGCAMLVVLVALRAVGWITPEQFDTYTKLGEATIGFGLRDAFSKLPR